jgi:hypothetical protein
VTAALLGCQVIFDDPCGIGTAVGDDPSPRAECRE